MKRIILILTVAFISAAVLSQENNKAECKRQLSEINKKIADNPDNISYYYARAEVYNNLDDFARANRDYNKVLDMYQDNPELRYKDEFLKASYRLADDHFFRSSNDQKALSYVKQALAIEPDNTELLGMQAITLGKDESEKELACAKFEKLINEHPDNTWLRLHFAQFLEGFDPLYAAAQYEKIVNLEPTNTSAMVAAGTLYNNQAHQISKSADEAADAAMVYALAKKATHYFEQASNQNPGNSELNNITEQLNKEIEGQPKEEEKKAEEKNVPF